MNDEWVNSSHSYLHQPHQSLASWQNFESYDKFNQAKTNIERDTLCNYFVVVTFRRDTILPKRFTYLAFPNTLKQCKG